MKSMKVMGIGEMVAVDQFLAVKVFDLSDQLFKRGEHGRKAGPPSWGNVGL